ncbi:allergen Tha p 1 [Bicyclus anynana]|uniref:Allergen Tha p 1 n=1 Tax=Bicyclus anynana TaxID=110368 RepID=A0A6J1NBX5_BICAN|nr:allergen Tha p 1 [Bicyclus anynana]
MKTIIVLATLVAAALAIPSDTYNPQYDSFNAQEVADNIRLLKNYGKCFLDQGPCTAEGNDFKKVIPEALRTTCAKCTEKQKELIRIIIKAFQEKLPEVWAELIQKEDPKGIYKPDFDKFLHGSN